MQMVSVADAAVLDTSVTNIGQLMHSKASCAWWCAMSVMCAPPHLNAALQNVCADNKGFDFMTDPKTGMRCAPTMLI
jgi:hypothetical protein